MKNFLIVLLILVIIVSVNNISQAYVASSPNFRIEYDSLNAEGGSESSASYNLEDTMGEDAIGISDSANFKTKAGFQYLGEYNLSISSPSDVTLSPNIGGITGGSATGSVSWDVTTDNPGGYTLSIKSADSPAMQTGGGDTIANYTPTDSNIPDYNWSVPSNASEFGFSPKGNNLISKFKDNGSSACGTGTSQTSGKCWYNFNTAYETISQSTGANNPTGVSTTFNLKAEVGSNTKQKEGTYNAEITVTAYAN